MVRRPDYNKGRWQLERERHHLHGMYPPSPDKTEPISDLVNAFFKKLENSGDRWLDDLERQWAGIVGEGVASHARPGRWQAGELFVFVDSSVWLNELKRYSEKELLEKLQAAFGANRIRSLRLQLDPERR